MIDFQLDTSGVVRFDGGTLGYISWDGVEQVAGKFTQGYVEALFGSMPVLIDKAGPTLLKQPGFRHLAPETLATIIRDCAAFLPKLNVPANTEAGAWFWGWRRDNWLSAEAGARRSIRKAFPPLTPILGDDGLIYFREAA